MKQVNVQVGFNEQILEALKNKVATLPPESKLCAFIMDEMVIKESLVYNSEKDEIEGFEKFGMYGRTKYVSNYAIVFMVRGLVKMEATNSIFSV